MNWPSTWWIGSFRLFASGYDDYEQQFAYFTSVEAIKKANPAEFEGAENMVSILTEVISAPEAIRDILGAEKPIKELIKMFIQEWGPKLAIEKGKEYITPN